MLTMYNGQPIPVTGWFADAHGHRLFLREGDIAPICPHGLPALVLWRLLTEIATKQPEAA